MMMDLNKGGFLNKHGKEKLLHFNNNDNKEMKLKGDVLNDS